MNNYDRNHGASNNDRTNSNLNNDFQSEPVLSFGAMRRLNKKGVFFLLLIAGIGLALVAWGWSQFSFFDAPAPTKPQKEVVEIPEDPPLPPLPESPPMPEAIQVEQTESLPPPQVVQSPRPQVSDLNQRRLSGSSILMGSSNKAAQASGAFQVDKGSVNKLHNTDYLLTRGTFVRCVLETRIVSDVAGFTSCIVTEPVYSMNGKNLLIPQGSKVSGQYKKENLTTGRVSVVWERVLTPNGLSIGLVSPGAGSLGSAGHKGRLNRHWGSRIAAALMISLLGDAVQIGSNHVAPEDSRRSTTIESSAGAVATQTDPFNSQTAKAVQQLSQQALQELAQRPPTITINQGQLINIYTARDIDFSSVLP